MEAEGQIYGRRGEAAKAGARQGAIPRLLRHYKRLDCNHSRALSDSFQVQACHAVSSMQR
eukprot:5205412-Pleurochrysis_carterae.AAC.1